MTKPYDSEDTMSEFETIFLVEELWADSMENDLSRAIGYRPIGFVTTQKEADTLVMQRGVEMGDGWPINRGDSKPSR